MHFVRRTLCIAILGLLAAWLAWWSSAPRSNRSAPPAGHAAAVRVSQSSVPAEGGGDRRAEKPVGEGSPAVPSAAPASDSAPPARFAFDALTAGREPVKTEARMFQAQKWEPDIAKVLELPPGTLLQRRSAWYHIPELKFPLVRVDRIYRMDRGRGGKGGATGSVASGTRGPSGSVAPQTTTASGPVAPLAAPEGELLWDNAMIADHLMVQAQLGVTREQFQRVLPAPCRILSAVSAEKGLYLVGIPHDGDGALERAMLALNHESLKKTITFAEPDFLMSGADTTPDDPYFTTSSTDTTKQWHLPKIMAPRAWDVIKQPGTTTIANTTVVAVVDTGVDYTHPDLSPNLYLNPGETGGGKESNNADDDGNGKVDDWRGWNFVENNNDPMDDVGHGTHVAGIIGSVGNNAEGTSGVCWGVKLLPLRIIKKLGLGTYGTYSDAVASLLYIRTLNSPLQRVRVANHSWGGSGYSLAMLNAVNNPVASIDPLPTDLTSSYARDVNVITVGGAAGEIGKVKVGMTICGAGLPPNTRVAIINGSALTLTDYSVQGRTNDAISFTNPERPKQYGVVHVAAAGNSRFNLDRVPTYPASLPSGFMLSVGATDVNDEPAIWSGGAGSNYGRLTVDIFAPGSSVWSTKRKAPGDSSYGYESRNGTSMAAPLVAGALALLRMWQPTLTDTYVRQIALDQAERVPALDGKCLSGGRLDVAGMVDRLYQPILSASGGGTSGGVSPAQALSVGLGLTGQIAMGYWHTAAIRNGRVYVWGGTDTFRADPSVPPGGGNPDYLEYFASATPVLIPALEGVTMVAALYNLTYAVKRDGTVWGWSTELHAALADPGSTADITPLLPQQITGLWEPSDPHPQAVWIAAPDAGSHLLVANEDGSCWSWGINTHGQLGDGTTTFRATPAKVPGLSDVVMVAAGADINADYSLALKRDGTVWHFGSRLGLSPSTPSVNLSPTQVAGLSRIIFIAAGWNTAYAIDEDGAVWWWGEEPYPSSGHYPARSPAPLRLDGVSGVVSIAAGLSHALAIDVEARVWTWGRNVHGDLGRGPNPNPAPAVVLLDDVEGVGGIAANYFGCTAMLGSGDVLTWGSNQFGQLGAGQLDSTNLPIVVPGLNEVAFITGGDQPVIRKSDGSFWTWGYFNPVPVPFAGPQPSLRIEQMPFYDGGFSVAMKTDQTLWAWGYSWEDGRFGNTSVPDYTTVDPWAAVPVQGLGAVQDYAIADADADAHCLAVLPNGTVKAWGYNGFGQLGDGTITDRRLPVSVSGLTNVAEVAAGDRYSLARKHDGTVWAWGRNAKGQLGDGTATSRATPVQVTGLTQVIQIDATDDAGIALKSNGTVWVWGKGTSSVVAPASQPGLVDQRTPAQVPGLPFITAIHAFTSFTDLLSSSANVSHVLALAADGRAWAWSWRRTVLGRTQDSIHPGYVPQPVTGLANIAAISSGPDCAYAVATDGRVWAWGNDFNSGLGVGLSESSRPVKVVNLGGGSSTLSTLGAADDDDSWQLQHFSLSELLDATVIDDHSDPDGDGIPNLMEYALGLDPRARGSGGLPAVRVELIAPRAQSEGHNGSQISLFDAACCCGARAELVAGNRYPVFTVSRQQGIRQDIDYIVEQSEDLQLWHSGEPYMIKVLDTAEILEVYSATAIEDAPRQFMRLKVRRK